MKIQSISIKNFRSIKNAVIRMHDITAIVGENNAGKTAVLRALNAVMNFEEEEDSFVNYRHRYAPRSVTYITIVFEDIPERFLDKSVGGTMTICFTYNYSKRRKQYSYKGENGEENVLDDSFISEISSEIRYVYIPTDRADKDMIWEENSIFMRLLSAYLAQQTENRDMISTHVRNATNRIHSSALKSLEKKLNNLYMQNKSIDFQVGFPADLDYTVLLRTAMISLNEYGQNYLLQDCGSGTKSLAVIAMHRALALLNRTSIVLGIEEPEENLHPQAQKRFILSLKDGRHINETQSIFTTHSTVLVDSLRHDDIVLVRRKKDKRGFVSEIAQLPDDFWKKYNIEEFKHYQYFNYKNSDFFFAKFIVIGESKNDCQVFESLITPNIGDKSSDVSYLDAGGINNIIYPYFLMKELRIPNILVVDRDYFFSYINSGLENSRNNHSGLPVYASTMNHNAVLDDLFPNEHLRNEIEDAHNNGYRQFFDKIKLHNILSMNYCMEMDLTCSKQAREQYYNILHINNEALRTQKNLLEGNANAIKKIAYIDKILKTIPVSALPESYKKIKNYIAEKN